MAKCPKCGKYWDCGEIGVESKECSNIKDCSKCWCLDCKGYTPEILKMHEIVQLGYIIELEKYRIIDKSLKPETVQSGQDLIKYYENRLKELTGGDKHVD
jgi:hypothetical protein